MRREQADLEALERDDETNKINILVKLLGESKMGNKVKVSLIQSSDIMVADEAISKCWDKKVPCHKTADRIERVANKNKHSSTIEHLVYTFGIEGISRACLQELARHRIASLSVKSTRYTLKELLRVDDTDEAISKFLVFPNNIGVHQANIQQLKLIKKALKEGVSNDIIKYALPEAYKTSLVWTINARSLQNFLELRTAKAALWEIRELAYKIYAVIPNSHKFLFKQCIYNIKEEALDI